MLEKCHRNETGQTIHSWLFCEENDSGIKQEDRHMTRLAHKNVLQIGRFWREEWRQKQKIQKYLALDKLGVT